VGETQIRQTARVHRVRAGDHPIQQHAKAVDVGLNGRIAAAKQLRCEIEGSPRERAPGAGCASEFPAGAEVHQYRTSVVGEHHILSLDVTVQKTGSVNRGNGVTDLESDLNCLGRVQRRSLCQPLLDRLAIDPFHPEADCVADPLRAVNRDDIGMAHAREEAAFLDDRRRTRFARVRVRGEELQRDFAIETCIPGTEHVSKGAAAKRLEDAKMAPCLRPRCRFGAALPMEVDKGREKS
jgi:hypothetical protein